MQQPEAHPYLQSKKITDLYGKYKTDLLQVHQNRSVNGIIGMIKSVIGQPTIKNRISNKNAELGLLLINEHPQTREPNRYWYANQEVEYRSNRYNRIEKLLGDKEWEDEDNFGLLVYFLGEEKAAYARHAWKDIPNQMYQSGYMRRSFRSPHNREMYLRNQINFIVQLLPQVYTFKYDNNGTHIKTCYDLTVPEQIKYNHTIGDVNAVLFRLWAAAINMDNTAVFKQLEEIIFNRDETGKITRSIIKALLNSNKPEAWELVEKLLLAAQRQEGLRQTILEALDETSTGALKYMIGVIIKHQLARFSSVVRAVDVWAGLGWESERESTVRNFLEKAQLYLESPEKISEAIKSDNNADVYMALWAQGVYDVEQTIPYLKQLSASTQTQKRTLAILFASQTHHYKIDMPCYFAALADTEIEPLACAINFIYQSVQAGENNKHYDRYYPELFDDLDSVFKRISVREKTISNYIFSWTKIHFDKRTILKTMIRLIVDRQDRLDRVTAYYEDMDADTRRQLSRIILPIQSEYSFKPTEKASAPLTSFQRTYALKILEDRSEYGIGYNALYDTRFSTDEMELLPPMLKRKSADFRNKIISIILKQNDSKVIPVVKQLLLLGDPEQRLAGLDILLQMKKINRLVKESQEWLTEYSSRKSISTKEEILLNQLTETEKIKDVSAANGYGLFNMQNLSPIVKPAINAANIYEKLYSKNAFAFSLPFQRVKKSLEDLYNIYLKHKDFEYEIEYWNKTREKVLLGNVFRNKNNNVGVKDAVEEYQNYPLPEVWDEWFKQSGLQPVDLYIISLSVEKRENKYNKVSVKQVPLREDLMPQAVAELNYYRNPILGICSALSLIHPFPERNEFYIGACTRLFASLDQSILQAKLDSQYYYSAHRGWQGDESLNIFLRNINVTELDAKDVEQCWNLYHWRQFSGLREFVADSMPPFVIFCKAFEHHIINEDELMYGMLTTDSIKSLSQKIVGRHDFDYHAQFPFLKSIFQKVYNHVLDIELKRGDSATPVTRLASSLQIVFGIDRLTELLAGLGKTNLFKGYIYSGGENINKQEAFSTLIKRCQPLPEDTQSRFDEAMQKIKVSENRLIEMAIYAPQWQQYVSNYLGWKGLDTAIWWMHAHTKTYAYHAHNVETESEIAKHSTLDVEEFKDGAVDKEWFEKAYKEIGKDRWSKLYDAAKYISDGNGHRRARIYADVLLGNLKIDEVTEKISTKRDQDYLRVYGLIPLHKKNSAKDVLERYEFIQKFRKESKQFGNQKQTSEAAAIKVGLENLSRNAGYADPIRFTWAMETRQVQMIFSKETQVQYDDILIGLVIDEDGLADVVAFKDEKQLKAIPAKYKKDKKVEELMGFRKTLREQLRRSLKGLEDAMVRGDAFQYDEINSLFTHPVISKHLEKLVFITDRKEGANHHGFYLDKKLVSAGNQEYDIVPSDNLRIAHCTDLFDTGEWATYQRYAFDKKLQQPFKQVFRELYLPTEDELNEKSISRRYAGHQVQPKQTVALLKSRGWKANYEEGLQKLYRKEGFVVRMYAMADWFSPAEVESPTLETIQFEQVKNFELVPFMNINPRIFSEVMRDIDLVVSVAHAGAVDAEASHSSIEMRAVLLRETLRLFKIKNVEIAGSHAIIKGKLGEYNVHLGSAVVHQMAAGYLSIIPIHSQHRGRLFLPFVDDDPKSAELISKVLLLARDNEIQDPTILRQLKQ